MTGMNENPLDLLPEVLLAASAVLGLLLGAWLPRRRQWLVGALAGAACAGGLVAAAIAATTPVETAFGGAFALDTLSATSRIVILGATLLVLALAAPRLYADPRETEFHVLLQLSSVGALTLAGAQDLLLLAAGYLLASVPAYALAGFRKDGPGTEAALKFYVLGAFLGVLMLTGITVLLAAGRTTAYPVLRTELAGAPTGLVAAGTLALLTGVLFKAGAVPAHFWVPDAVQGSSEPVAAFLTTIPKIGALVAFYRLAVVPLADADLPWAGLVAVLSVASMTLGNLAAFFQQDVTRLLAYSTISQVGYLLLPVAVAGRTDLDQEALLYYLAGYALTNLGAFAVVCALPGARTVDDYRGLARTRPALLAALVVCLLGLVGTPPTAVFLGKLEAFSAAFDGGYAWLAVVAAVNTVASLFYYLRWIAPAFLASGPAGGPGAMSRSAAVIAYGAATGSVVLGLLGGSVLDVLGGPPAP
ncbi:NADH-quinone oxidoreductase subunit N [Streptomyces neyagawaensis]|uniref:NADH-quinone oxidoreductase subunit N n=1 Tax=Streptomyces neyagawaensis TaxID=42238 RepID=UPI0006E3E468|nr:NADH-quinone oxidoreductase subunit N [Streptomyces neyagawaensis]MCL6734830.1 NADH-quinone oxidoreductase subunit N [Streptomyces neyagawaensis]MDE1686504.1 NADH-quinone oxidoreductase subunit N [Streptomyces neyagawaensis]